MPTVECEHVDCRKHGIEICIAKRVRWHGGQCLEYEPTTKSLMAKEKPNCHRQNGKYKSDRVTGILK